MPLVDPALDDLPPAAKLVWVALWEESPRTGAELATETTLPQRTVRWALGRLEDRGVVERRPHPQDARKAEYELVGE